MDYLENPFKPLTIPDFWALKHGGMTPQEAHAFRQHVTETIGIQHAYWGMKPSGELRSYLKEQEYYERESGPLRCVFSDQTPDGITRTEYLRYNLPGMIAKLLTEVRSIIDVAPTCAIADPYAASMIEYAYSFEGRDVRSNTFGPYAGSIGKLAGRVDVHAELECRPPYMLPAGEMWFMLAWRYDFYEERRTEWARPVAIVEFSGYRDSDMTHLAKCSRKYKSPLDCDFLHMKAR